MRIMETGDTALKLQVDYLPCTRIGLSIDHSPQLRHISIAKVLISGAGFLADAYDLFVINIAVDIMALCAYKQPLTTELISTVKSTAIAGAIVGQIFFGSLADLIGRKKVFVVTCFLIIAGAILSGLAVDSQHFGIYSQVALWRFVLGVGIGGEYPLSAAITTESSSKGKEIRNLAMVFSMQGLGTMLCALVLVTVTRTLGERYDLQWRLALLLGAAPMAASFFFRWRMKDTSWRSPTRKELHANPHHDEYHSIHSRTWPAGGVLGYLKLGLFNTLRIVHYNFWPLLGTAGAWCLLDVVFYANGLFSGQVTEAMHFADSPRSEAAASLLLQSISLPGYLCAIFFADTIGLRRLQLYGFAVTTTIFLALSVLQPHLEKFPALYATLYGLTFFAQNFGPNTTTYIIPSLLFAAEHRGTCHGISAAAGKFGALLAAQVFLYLVGSFCAGGTCTSDSSRADVAAGLRLTFFVCGGVGVIGFFWTYFLVPEPQLRGAGKENVTTPLGAEDTSSAELEEQEQEHSGGEGYPVSPGVLLTLEDNFPDCDGVEEARNPMLLPLQLPLSLSSSLRRPEATEPTSV